MSGKLVTKMCFFVLRNIPNILSIKYCAVQLRTKRDAEADSESPSKLSVYVCAQVVI